MYDTALTVESIDDDATYQPDGQMDTIEEEAETDDEVLFYVYMYMYNQLLKQLPAADNKAIVDINTTYLTG